MENKTAVEWLYEEIKHIIPDNYISLFQEALELEKQQQKAMTPKEKIKQVIDGEVDSVDLPMLPLNEYSKIFNELGIEFLPEFMDTNGWEIDFGFALEHNSENYLFQGSLWYGKFRFRKYEKNLR